MTYGSRRQAVVAANTAVVREDKGLCAVGLLARPRKPVQESVQLQLPAVVVLDLVVLSQLLDDPERGALLNGLKVKAIYPFELSINKFNLMKGEDL